jgi:hypothetical protein
MYLLPLPPVHCRYQYYTTTTTTTTTTTAITDVIIVVTVLVTLNILISLAYHSKSPSTPSLLRCASNILLSIRPSSTFSKYSNQLEMLSLGDIPVVLRSINVSKEVSTYTTLHYEDDYFGPIFRAVIRPVYQNP